jgi:hypothetical protein
MSRARRVLTGSRIRRDQRVTVFTEREKREKRQMTAPTNEKLTCASQSATSFPEPNATMEVPGEAAAVRLNLLAEAEIYSTDTSSMVMSAEPCQWT